MDIVNILEQEIIKQGGQLNIAIAGPTCSGKTTIANILRDIFDPKYATSIVHQDDYFKDLNKIPRTRFGYLMDSINAFESYEFKSDVQTLLTNGSVIIPRYDINKNQRISKDIHVSKGQINIFEGLHTIRLLSDDETIFKVFLDVPLDICLARRIKRDSTSYNISEDRIKEYFDNCMIPMYRDYGLPQKNIADVILDEGGKVKCRLLKR